MKRRNMWEDPPTKFKMPPINTARDKICPAEYPHEPPYSTCWLCRALNLIKAYLGPQVALRLRRVITQGNCNYREGRDIKRALKRRLLNEEDS